MEVGSLVLGAVLLVALGFASAVLDHGRQLQRTRRQSEVPQEAAAPAPATGSEPQG